VSERERKRERQKERERETERESEREKERIGGGIFTSSECTYQHPT
jgi:hypothetical protein